MGRCGQEQCGCELLTPEDEARLERESERLKNEKSALIMVDVQNDFCPGGALAVIDGDKVVEPLNLYQESVSLVVATRDWHPAQSKHFKSGGGLWPVHCVAGTRGAEFHPALKVDKAVVVSKGMDPENDGGYSGFDGVTENGKTLEELLRSRGITNLYVGGLATDYCVKATVLGALKKGFNVLVLYDAIRSVNLSPDDGKKAFREMHEAGAVFIVPEEMEGAYWQDLGLE